MHADEEENRIAARRTRRFHSQERDEGRWVKNEERRGRGREADGWRKNDERRGDGRRDREYDGRWSKNDERHERDPDSGGRWVKNAERRERRDMEDATDTRGAFHRRESGGEDRWSSRHSGRHEFVRRSRRGGGRGGFRDGPSDGRRFVEEQEEGRADRAKRWERDLFSTEATSSKTSNDESGGTDEGEVQAERHVSNSTKRTTALTYSDIEYDEEDDNDSGLEEYEAQLRQRGAEGEDRNDSGDRDARRMDEESDD